ncbi:MAG: hypothetical protein AAF492_20500, partial [Verrucomicrobiota bacterium]
MNFTADVVADVDFAGAAWEMTWFWGSTNGGTDTAAWEGSAYFGWYTDVVSRITNSIGGLDPLSTYQVALRLTNCSAEVWVPAGSFTTGSGNNIPVVSNGSGAIRGEGFAQLNWDLERGGDAAVQLYWGATDGGSNASAWQAVADAGLLLEGTGSLTVSGLIFGVQYYYRSFASNDFGIGWADSTETFKAKNPDDSSLSAWLHSTQRSDGTNILNGDTGSVSLDWMPHELNGDYFSHSTGTADEVTVLVPGDYFVAFTLPMTNINDSVDNRRTCIRAELFVNGSPMSALGAVGESSYMRGYQDPNDRHHNASDHFATLITNVPAGAVLEIRTRSTASSNGDVRMEQASLYVEYVDPSRDLFAAVTTDGNQDMTPPAPRTIEWEDTVRNDSGYSFPNPSNIVLGTAGAYLVFINMPYYSPIDRDAAKLTVQLDGATVPGGLAMQGYIRNRDGHNHSSIHWSGMLISTQANQILSITTEQEADVINPSAVIVNGRMSIMIERVDTAGVFFSR